MVNEISLGTLIVEASFFVQTIVFILVVMSVICWAVILQKTQAVRRAKKNIQELQVLFDSDMDLQTMFNQPQVKSPLPMSRVLLTVVLRWTKLNKGNISAEKKDIDLERCLEQSVDKETSVLENNLHILAIVSSTAPFVGLLGTVWGIMNSFVAIASNKQASLSVVAPGIAEALFVTALGLITAIPAMIAYNKFSHDMDMIQSDMDTVGADLIQNVLKGRL